MVLADQITEANSFSPTPLSFSISFSPFLKAKGDK